MKMLKGLRLGTSVSAAVLSAVLGMSAAGGALVLTSTAAYAQTALDSTQLSAIQTALTTALQNAHGDSTAIQAAISTALQNAISIYGSDAAGSITSAIMTDAELAGVSPSDTGAGLAQAAAAVAATNAGAAATIASTVANGGNASEVVAFQSTATSLGYTNLASIAGSGSTGATGAVGGGLTGGGFGNVFSGGFSGGGGGGGGGGCLNPSCTKL
ncbi:MAG: hypothetical protein KGJ78_18585 [Alphaproteobacteria bacterium]|nr:hypothetical protein [Alphaproteobacteria bacterium]